MKSSYKPSHKSFVILMAMLMSLTALSIDAMLPALSQIGTSLNVQNPNNTQFIVSAIFLGMSLGLMIYGPLSDSLGRKKAIYIGIGIFLIGNLVSLFATSFTLMLIGRLLQGFGVAACRVVTMAMIRDKFEGHEMAKVMSLIMMFFILVPALAPAIGQGILFFADWHGIFVMILTLGIIGGLWLYLGQEETLLKENRLKFTSSVIKSGIIETLTHPISRGYMLASGIIFGAFIGYLSSAQQILQIQYKLGDAFPLYFGCLALAIGFSSFINSRLLAYYSMVRLCLVSLSIITTLSLSFFIYIHLINTPPSLLILMLFLLGIFFCVGTLFGNFNAMATQPMGHIAGVAASVISSIQTIISVSVGGTIGHLYDGTVQPLVLGFLICGASTLCLVVVLEKNKHA